MPLSSARLPAICFWIAFAPAAFAAADRPPADNARLRDTHWRVQSIDGSAVSSSKGVEPHLVLNGGSQQIGGFAGCNRLQGRYVQRGTQLAVSVRVAAKPVKDCAEARVRFEQNLLRALASVDAYRIEGSVLSLMQGETVRLTFVAGKAQGGKRPK